jgi:hypothetical protein
MAENKDAAPAAGTEAQVDVPREQKVWGFLKFAREFEHAEQFRAGRLYMNAGSYFRKCEAGACDIGDNREGTDRWLNRNAGYRIEFGVPQPDGSTKMHTIEPGEWADHAAVSLSDGNDVKLFCVTALRLSDTQAHIDTLVERWRGDYPFAVGVRHAREICSRFMAAVKAKGWTGRCKDVRYFDPDEHDGVLSPPWFWKRKAFEWQTEWRFLVGAEGSNALAFDIGPLHDICTPTIDLAKGAGLEVVEEDLSG